MAEEFDRKILPGFVQSAFNMSLGCLYLGVEMLKSPQESAEKILHEVQDMVTIPPEAGGGIQNKAQALASVWMEKGAGWMEACKSAGNRFTSENGS